MQRFPMAVGGGPDFALREHLAILEEECYLHPEGRDQMLLNILHCTGQAHHKELSSSEVHEC